MAERRVPKQRFKLGQRVYLSKAWYEHNRQGRPERSSMGVVVGLYALDPLTVKVLIDGRKTPSLWHADFWSTKKVKTWHPKTT